jgi:hypothetical protein
MHAEPNAIRISSDPTETMASSDDIGRFYAMVQTGMHRPTRGFH